MFWRDCKEWRSQSFSSVGAQHQNAHAEHAIQNIMYMAQTMFISHASLHWTERVSDDLSLSGPLQVKSSVQVYNDVPDVWSGLSP
jgi:hypothetical protein